MYEVTYSFIFICNILICYKNIYQVLVQVCVVLQLHLEVNITNLLWIEVEVREILIPFFCFFQRRHFKNGLGEAMYHQICTVDTLYCH